jgi:hypothetical protein
MRNRVETRGLMWEHTPKVVTWPILVDRKASKSVNPEFHSRFKDSEMEGEAR